MNKIKQQKFLLGPKFILHTLLYAHPFLGLFTFYNHRSLRAGRAILIILNFSFLITFTGNFFYSVGITKDEDAGGKGIMDCFFYSLYGIILTKAGYYIAKLLFYLPDRKVTKPTISFDNTTEGKYSVAKMGTCSIIKFSIAILFSVVMLCKCL